MYQEWKNAYNQHNSDMHDVSPVPVRCANCDIEILWPPVIVQAVAYCCTGCAAGGPCSCDYSQYCSATISGVIQYGPPAPDEAQKRNTERPDEL